MARTQEEIEALKAVTQDPERQEAYKRLREAREREEQRWDAELAMLTRRVHEEYHDIDLGHGDTIKLRACLSETEEVKLAKLIDKWRAGDSKSSYEIISLVTANPLITPKWLKENPDKFSVTDLLEVLFGLMEQRTERHRLTMERVKRMSSFRTEPPGSEHGGLPASSGDSGPQTVG